MVPQEVTMEDLALIQHLDFTPTFACEIQECQDEAKWSVIWTCGCSLVECEAHKVQGMEASTAGLGCCPKHGIPKGKNCIRTCEPI